MDKDRDKNKIADTDSFWDQLDTKLPVEKETSFPITAEKADGSIAIDRDQLIRAVGQLSQNQIDEKPLSYAEKIDIEIDKQQREEEDLFVSRKQKRNASTRDRKTSSRHQPGKNKENSLRPSTEKIKDSSVSMNKNTIIAIVAAAAVCIGSFLGIFYKLNADKKEMMDYIQTELADIRAKNDAAIAEMGDTLDRMETNFDEIVSLLEETGAAIGSSSQESRAAISERIEKLDKQLQSLQKSLAILQEDANGRKK